MQQVHIALHRFISTVQEGDEVHIGEACTEIIGTLKKSVAYTIVESIQAMKKKHNGQCLLRMVFN